MNHVLIVDDDVDFANALRDLIMGPDFSVATAHSLRDAQRRIAMQQPDRNGMALFADRQLLADAEVVLITGTARWKPRSRPCAWVRPTTSSSRSTSASRRWCSRA